MYIIQIHKYKYVISQNYYIFIWLFGVFAGTRGRLRKEKDAGLV